MDLIRRDNQIILEREYWYRRKDTRQHPLKAHIYNREGAVIFVDRSNTQYTMEQAFRLFDIMGPIPSTVVPNFDYYINKENEPAPQNLCCEIAMPTPKS